LGGNLGKIPGPPLAMHLIGLTTTAVKKAINNIYDAKFIE